jgi:ATP-dependent DNA helicase RecQ
MSGSGIIYTATTRSAETVAEWLTERGVSADFYHGRRRAADRERVQDEFMSGDIRIIAATNAFGLGVDKQDVRFVLHLEPPPSVEAYYQEAGRGGRDGEPARCILLSRDADLSRTRFLAGTGQTTVEDLERVRNALRTGQPQTREKLRIATGLSRAAVQRAIDVLGDSQLVRVHRGRVGLLVDDFEPSDVSIKREEERRTYDRSRLEMLRAYVELRECRRRFLVNYFGENYASESCGYCDNDTEQGAGQQAVVHRPAQNPTGLAEMDRVRHENWGEGVITRIEGDVLTALFDSVGYKTFDANIVNDRGILQRTDMSAATKLEQAS